jgi:hypothetical protein
MNLKRILYAPWWMPSINVEYVCEAIFTLSLDGIIVGEKGM